MEESILFDGAFGTYYESLTQRGTQCELANVDDPRTVLDIHRAYIAAGAGAIKTNTFGVNSLLVTDPVRRLSILDEGYELACRAAVGTGTQVFADIGPIGREDADDEYVAIAEAFLRKGAACFLFETLAELTPLLPVLAHIRARSPQAVVIVSFAVAQDGYTRAGQYYLDLITQASDAGADYTGLNCICGPAHMLDLLRRVDTGTCRLAVMPNAGYSAQIGGRTVFRNNPGYFADKMLEIRALGVPVLGGCCGTTPLHIQAVAQRLSPSIGFSGRPAVSHTAQETTVPKEGLFGRAGKVVAVEIDPPLHANAAYLLSASRTARDAGADLVTVADSPLARSRADSILMAAKVQRETGIPVMPHLSCRDRNQIGLKGALTAACIEGIRQVLVVTGDPAVPTQRGEGRGVFSLNAVQLAGFISSLNRDEFAMTPMAICAALNVNAVNFEAELRRAQAKVDQGVVALLSQPLSSRRSIDNLLLARQRLRCRLLAGILPFASYRNALFLNNEVAGIEIPLDLLDALRDLPADEARQLSLEHAGGILREVYPHCDGFYLMTPLRRIDLTAELIRQIRSIEHDCNR